MKLKKIKLENFKQFSNCVLNFNESDNIDILIGPNNSGKTSFMEALTKFLTRKSNNHFFFSTYDFPINLHSELDKKFNKLFELFLKINEEINEVKWGRKIKEFDEVYKDFKLLLPYLELKFEYEMKDLPIVKNFLYNLESHQESEKLINFALIYKPKDIQKLLEAYQEYRNEIEAFIENGKKKDKNETELLENYFSYNLIDFLQRDNTINNHFSCTVYILNPYKNDIKDDNRVTKYEKVFNQYSKMKFDDVEELIQVNTITAGRYLNDVDYEGRSIDVSDNAMDKHSRISQLINSLAKKEISPDENSTTNLTTVERMLLIDKLSMEKELKEIFEHKLNPLVKTFYGYPALHSPRLEVFPNVDLNTTIKDEADIKLTMGEDDSNITLPESYNGLGYRQLLFLHLKISNYLKEFKEKKDKGEVYFHLLLIEEPEVNLHAPIKRILIEDISKQFHESNSQVILSTHSNHLIDQVKFEQLHYIKADKNNSEILNLDNIKLHEQSVGQSNNRFIQKYFELHSHDIFFADGIIVVEGNSEHTLIPHYIKLDEDYKELNNKYITFLNVGGAYIHKLLPLFEALKKPVLIITDLDSVNGSRNKEYVQKNDLNNQTTSNPLLKRFINNNGSDATINQLLTEGSGSFNSNKNIYVTFQNKEHKINGESVYARTFEDAFALQNNEKFAEIDFKKSFDRQGRGLLTEFRKIFSNNSSEEHYGKLLFEAITNDKKSDFALDLIYYLTFKDDSTNSKKPENITDVFSLPTYIHAGLTWLSTQLEQGGD